MHPVVCSPYFEPYIFKVPTLKISIRDNRSKYNEKICQPLPGHPELTSNKMAQIWNNLKLNNAKSIAGVRASALEWYWQNLQN